MTKRIEKQMDFVSQNFEETDNVKKEIVRMMVFDVVGAEKLLKAEIEKYLGEALIEYAAN